MSSLIVSVLASLGSEGLPRIWGYLDPGTGSMLFQVLVAGLLSSLFCAKSFCLNLRSALFKNHNKA
jgi:hypothetical protein